MKNDVYIYDAKIYEYNNESIFNPSKYYPEGINLEIKSDAKVYEAVRNLFIDMELDKKNIGNKYWNPFKDFIKENHKVIIKPNLVKHINTKANGTDCLITNFSVIRPIIDYTIKALNGTGQIIVGDAPVQECVFPEIIKINGLGEAIRIYNENGYNIKLIDFRKNDNKALKCKIVSLNENSSLAEVDKYWKKYAITNYDLREMHAHHNNGIHEYLIPNDILESDVIINLPKPKTHRKAGITACMKNFIGINGKKEYLPHHRNGSIYGHGDEYPERSIVKFLKSNMKNYIYKQNKIINLGHRCLSYLQRLLKKDRFQAGSWYGNDTIWRTILDINKIVLYSNKEGKMTNKIQRVIFNVADMIIAGEKEGPLVPSPKKVGLIIGGFNQLNIDREICKIMGFKPERIKYIVNGYKLEKYKISKNDRFKTFCEHKEVEAEHYNKHFIPTDGWIDYLLEKN